MVAPFKHKPTKREREGIKYQQSCDGMVLLIDYTWYHAVNDQHKLNDVLTAAAKEQQQLHAIEADIIYSKSQGISVMGHPPQVDSELALSSLLQQVHQSNFQQQQQLHSTKCNILKLDFKSMKALKSSLNEIQDYLKKLSPQLYSQVWINADILKGPGGGQDEDMKPKFDAVEFMELLTTETSVTASTTLSIGWTTSLTDSRAPYTQGMVDEMITLLAPYSNMNITFPIRASSLRSSWKALSNLYNNEVDKSKKWTVTLWWSLRSEQHCLSREEMNWIHNLLERGDPALHNRTYYDLVDFSPT